MWIAPDTIEEQGEKKQQQKKPTIWLCRVVGFPEPVGLNVALKLDTIILMSLSNAESVICYIYI